MTATALLVNPEQAGQSAPGHPGQPERVAAILRAIAQAGGRLGLEPEPAPAAPEELILRVHDQRYLAALDRAEAAGGGYLDQDTYLTKGSMLAARTAAGATVEGVGWVLSGKVRHAFAVVRPAAIMPSGRWPWGSV